MVLGKKELTEGGDMVLGEKELTEGDMVLGKRGIWSYSNNI